MKNIPPLESLKVYNNKLEKLQERLSKIAARDREYSPTNQAHDDISFEEKLKDDFEDTKKLINRAINTADQFVAKLQNSEEIEVEEVRQKYLELGKTKDIFIKKPNVPLEIFEEKKEERIALEIDDKLFEFIKIKSKTLDNINKYTAKSINSKEFVDNATSLNNEAEQLRKEEKIPQEQVNKILKFLNQGLTLKRTYNILRHPELMTQLEKNIIRSENGIGNDNHIFQNIMENVIKPIKHLGDDTLNKTIEKQNELVEFYDTKLRPNMLNKALFDSNYIEYQKKWDAEKKELQKLDPTMNNQKIDNLFNEIHHAIRSQRTIEQKFYFA